MTFPRSAWNRGVGLLMAALLVTAAIGLTQSAPRRVQAAHTTVELIADRQPDASTRELWLALRFELEQGWHVYWLNPGDSGGPPEVLWEPPSQLKLGQFEWPTPERIPVGPLVNYGYTNQVVLPFRVQLVKPLGPGTPVTLAGQVNWLICHEICIPGKASLAISLPLPPADRDQVIAWQKQIEAARRQAPKPVPATWRPKATSTREEFAVTFTPGRAGASAATFFPLEVSQINDSAPQRVTSEGGEVTIHLKKSDQLANDPRVLRGVVALGSGEAFVVEAPLAPAGARTGSRK